MFVWIYMFVWLGLVDLFRRLEVGVGGWKRDWEVILFWNQQSQSYTNEQSTQSKEKSKQTTNHKQSKSYLIGSDKQ